jgi:hypothetical protein
MISSPPPPLLDDHLVVARHTQVHPMGAGLLVEQQLCHPVVAGLVQPKFDKDDWPQLWILATTKK